MQFSPYHHSDVRKLAKKQSSKLVGPSHDPDVLKRRYGWLASDDEIESRGHLLCSLVTEYRKGDPKNTYGHVIHVPGFGNVFLAEADVRPGSLSPDDDSCGDGLRVIRHSEHGRRAHQWQAGMP